MFSIYTPGYLVQVRNGEAACYSHDNCRVAVVLNFHLDSQLQCEFHSQEFVLHPARRCLSVWATATVREPIGSCPLRPTQHGGRRLRRVASRYGRGDCCHIELGCVLTYCTYINVLRKQQTLQSLHRKKHPFGPQRSTQMVVTATFRIREWVVTDRLWILTDSLRFLQKLILYRIIIYK